MTNIVKINWLKDIYYDNGIRKLKNTNLPLTGIYEDENGTIHYYKNGKMHNENGPAYIRKDGHVIYYINGQLHRIDGPAAILRDGNCIWYINGWYIDKKTINKWLMENDIPLDWNIWSDSDKMMFALHWVDYSE